MYIHVHTCLLPISCLHKCMSRYVQLIFYLQVTTYIAWNVNTLLNGVCTLMQPKHTLMYPFGCSFLICPAGWPVGRVWLLPSVTPFKFKHASLIGISWGSLLLSTQCPRLPDRAGGRFRGCRHLPAAGGAHSAGTGVTVRRAGAGAGVRGVRALVASVVLLVLKLELDYPGLVAAGTLNPLDVLIIGGQDGLLLWLEGVRLHFGVCIYHRALVLKC
jgi:hypothetical protein